jgi:hypothetical protein
MTDTARGPQEPNWADYIDALRTFDPPTLRLARRQQALTAPADPSATSGQTDAGRWWHPPGLDNPRK